MVATVTPTLVHFSDGTDPRVVMNLSGELRRGEEFIYGWVIDRHEPASDQAVGYEFEVWLKPRQ
jgi:hypothetical protein